MGIENIEISTLSGKLQQLAQAADNDSNGLIENKEIEIFKDLAQSIVKNGQVSESDYKAIFGSEIKETTEVKAQTVTNPQNKTYSKKDVKRMEKYVLTILNEEFTTTPEELLERLTERLGVNVNDPMYKDLQGQVKYIMNAINEIGYNSKDQVDDLEKKVKEKLQIGRQDDFAKDVLEVLVKNAEYAQTKKEFEEIRNVYDTLVKAGINEEEAFRQTKIEFKQKGSYYKEILKDFEDKYIMPNARRTVREAIYQSEATTSRKVKKDVKKILKDNWNKYTKKALGGENNFGEWISGKDSDMKIARKNKARKNVVIDIRENGLTEEEIHDAVDKKRTFLFFKKKTQLFEALVSSGLIIDKGNGIYDVTPLSELIGLHVGSNYKMDRTSKDFKALAEKTKTTSALAAATELKNLTPKEAKMLVEMCGYEVEGKDLGKAILGATAGALVNGIGGAIATATNPRYVIDSVITNSNHIELNIKTSGETLEELASQFENNGGQVSLIEGGIQVIIDQKNVVPLFWKGSKHILNTAVKSSIIGAAVGLLTGLKDDPEKPITSTNFKCTTLEDYSKILDNEAKQNALKPEYKDALMMIAATFIKEDKNGNKYWDCIGYQKFLDHGNEKTGVYGAGSGSVLNREELIGLLEELKENTKEVKAKPVEEKKPEPEKVICENCDATKGKEQDTYADVKIPTIKKSEAKSWAASVATFYPCLVQAYGPGRAAQLLKAAQAVTDGDYNAERLLKLVRMSVADIRKMEDIKGFDKEYYIGLRLADDLPNNVFVPDSIADCDKKQNVKVGRANIILGGTRKAPSTDFTGYKIKTASGREYVDFCDGSRSYIPAGKTAQDVCKEKEESLRKQGHNVKISLR